MKTTLILLFICGFAAARSPPFPPPPGITIPKPDCVCEEPEDIYLPPTTTPSNTYVPPPCVCKTTTTSRPTTTTPRPTTTTPRPTTTTPRPTTTTTRPTTTTPRPTTTTPRPTPTTTSPGKNVRTTTPKVPYNYPVPDQKNIPNSFF